MQYAFIGVVIIMVLVSTSFTPQFLQNTELYTRKNVTFLCGTHKLNRNKN